MELTKMILEFFGKISWPITLMTIVFIFRKHLAKLIFDIRTFRAAGVELTMGRMEEMAKAALEVASESASEETIPENKREMMFQGEGPDISTRYPQGSRNGASTMLAFAAGRSFNENIKYNIYYDPATRNHSLPFEYIGLYKDGAIRSVGKVSKIVYCDYEDGKLLSTNNYDLGRLTSDESTRIKNIITETSYYEIDEGCKFFLVDKFYDTHLSWDTVIRGKQYVWLDEFEGFELGMSAGELAQVLRHNQ